MSDFQKNLPDGARPFTVILMLPDHMRSDECCAADWVRRVWVHASYSVNRTEFLISQARDNLCQLFEWDKPELGHSAEEVEQMKNELEPVAIYPGHIFDIYQP